MTENFNIWQGRIQDRNFPGHLIEKHGHKVTGTAKQISTKPGASIENGYKNAAEQIGQNGGISNEC
jgi:hypothetical protein